MSELFKFEDNDNYLGKNEYEMIDMAMNNAYIFLIGGEDWSKMKDPIVWMPMNQEMAESKEVFDSAEDDYDSSGTIDILIDYFSDREEFEKCAKLVNLIRIRNAREKDLTGLK